MIKRLFSKTGDPRARNDNIAAPHIPVASLLYFTGIPETSEYAVLNNVLMLTHSEVSEAESFITGQAINIPMRIKFGQLLQDFNHACHTQNRFLPIWRGSVGRFGVEDWSIVSMLISKSANLPKQAGLHEFGAFALYFPENPRSVDNVAKWAQTKKNPEPFLLTFGETVLEKAEIGKLQAAHYCHVTPATHEALFHPNARKRVSIAFPHLFENKPGGNAPTGP
ncbi:MAG TPA: hypothetical protein VFS88_03655 [Micavibrio sp.]|nr:hypothetical protein [Micavibrio sp.]